MDGVAEALLVDAEAAKAAVSIPLNSYENTMWKRWTTFQKVNGKRFSETKISWSKKLSNL